MGVIKKAVGGERRTLRGRHLVGRSRAADLRLDDLGVSGEHAVLWWTGAAWCLRDLGSRNGTTVEGQRLAPGEQVELVEGCVLGFGTSAWVLSSAAPPVPQATPLDGGEPVSDDHLLALPDPRSPTLTIFRVGKDQWCQEDKEGQRPIHDLDLVSVEGVVWRVHLPEAWGGTLEAEASPATIDTVGLQFRVSRDEEHVELSVVDKLHLIDLKARAHHYTLLVMARARLEDAKAPELGPSDCGWLYQDELLDMLKVEANKLNVDIYRARHQLAQAGIEGAARIVERRALTKQLRIGVERLKVIRI